MTIEEIKGVSYVNRDFFMDAMTVWAKRPVPRSAPDHNERTHDFSLFVHKAACAEGYPTVHLTLID